MPTRRYRKALITDNTAPGTVKLIGIKSPPGDSPTFDGSVAGIILHAPTSQPGTAKKVGGHFSFPSRRPAVRVASGSRTWAESTYF